jgi:ABC-type branched-subunit amino acid transport system ATPase component
MIRIENLTIAFGTVKPIVDLDLTLDGQIHGLIGPNGAGKTTLLNALSGFVRPAKGKLSVFDTDLGTIAAEARLSLGITRSFQTPQVALDMTVEENVRVTFDAVSLSRAETEAQLTEVLSQTGLEAHRHQPAAAMDGYHLRMTEIARCIAAGPRLVMLDEPAAGLAAPEREALKTLLRRLPELGTQVLLIDHDFELIGDLCDKVACLDFGTLVANGATEATLSDPDVRGAYLGETRAEAAA